MSPDLALLSSLIGSNYPCLELIFMVPKVFKPLKFNCIITCTKLLPCYQVVIPSGAKNGDYNKDEKKTT